MGDKGGAIALIAEAPDGAAFRGLEVRQANLGTRVDEIGQRIVALDGETADSG